MSLFLERITIVIIFREHLPRLLRRVHSLTHLQRSPYKQSTGLFIPSARFPFETWSLCVVSKDTSLSSLFLRFLELPSSATGGGRSRHLRASIRFAKKQKTPFWVSLFFGADNEARTRYLHLGKVALYQMSYIRILLVPPDGIEPSTRGFSVPCSTN